MALKVWLNQGCWDLDLCFVTSHWRPSLSQQVKEGENISVGPEREWGEKREVSNGSLTHAGMEASGLRGRKKQASKDKGTGTDLGGSEKFKTSDIGRSQRRLKMSRTGPGKDRGP